MHYPLAKLPEIISIRRDVTDANTNNPRAQRKSTPGFIEQETQINTLKKENFSLKMRIYFLTENMEYLGPESIQRIIKEHAELKCLLSMKRNDDQYKDATADRIFVDPLPGARMERKGGRVDVPNNSDQVNNTLLGNTLAAVSIAPSVPVIDTNTHLKHQIQALTKVRQILIGQLKAARRDLKRSIVVNDAALTAAAAKKPNKSLKFIAVTLAEMSLGLDLLTYKIYKDFVRRKH